MPTPTVVAVVLVAAALEAAAGAQVVAGEGAVRGRMWTPTAATVVTADDDDGSWAARWMAAVAGGTMALYVERLCGIPRLTPGGAAQLATDVEYVMTVAAALGVTPVPALALARRLLEVEPAPDAIRAAVEETGGGAGAGGELV
eukprot:contig_27494_g6763